VGEPEVVVGSLILSMFQGGGGDYLLTERRSR